MQLLRKILFYIFTLIYIIICPLAILYAFGYIYKPGTQGGVVKTGLIYLSTAPAGATILMDGSKYTQKTPAVIRDLLPGHYPIKMNLEDYVPWSRNVPVEAEKATVLDKILLLPLQWESMTLLTGEKQDITAIPGTDFFLVKSGAAAGDILVCDYESRKAWPLLDDSSPFEKSKIAAIFSSGESPYILLNIASPAGTFLWIELKDDKNAVKDISNLIQKTPLQVKWLPDQKDLFVLHDGQLVRINVESGAVYPGYLQNVRGYDLFNNEMYLLMGDNTFQRMGLEKNGTKMLLGDPELGKTIFRGKGIYGVEVLSEDFIIFLGEDGELLTNRLPYRFVDKGVRGYEFYPKLERVLVWTKDRIGVLDFSTEETQDAEFEIGPRLTWIYTKGKNIEQAFWVYEASHILFRDGKDTLLIEVEGYGEFKIAQILGVKEKSSVFYSDETGDMYYLDSSTGELLLVEIVPVEGVISLPFPEINGETKDKKIEELWNSGSQEAD